MLIDGLASLDQVRQVASQLERTSVTRTKMPNGQAGKAELHVIAARCTDMVEAVAPDLFRFQSKRARCGANLDSCIRLHLCRNKLHFTGVLDIKETSHSGILHQVH